MLTKEEYRSIASHWKGTVYQNYDRYQVRFPMFLKHIDVFKGKNVLEVGSNAGIAAYHIAQVAKSYIGIEGQKDYWLQAQETKKFIYNNNAEFLNMSVKSYMKRAIRDGIEITANACYLSYVLYHFSDKEVRMFEQNILPKLDVIVVQSRYENRNKKGRTAHNSYKFWEPKNVEKYLNKNGFSTTVEYGPRNKFHFIVGKKLKGEFVTYSQEIEEALKVASEMPKIAIQGGKVSGDHRMITETNSIVEIDKVIEEKLDGDKGNSTAYRESEGTGPRRQSSSNRQPRKTKRMSQLDVEREIASEGKSQDLLPKKRRNRNSSLLQSGMEKGTENTIRKKDVSKAKQTTRSRVNSSGRKNNQGENKSTIQECET